MNIHTFTTGLIVVGVACAGFALPAAASAPAAAAEQNEEFVIPFAYTRAELQTEQKASELLVRLERDVRKQCGPVDARSIAQQRLMQTCVDATMKTTIAKIGSATLAAAYETRGAG